MRTKSIYIRLINNLPILLLLILPFVVLVPTIGSINYPAGGDYTDLAITHLPNAEFIKHSIMVDHQIPLWNPMIMSGYPFAGDPLSGLWYPPGWLALFFPLPFGINLTTGLHIGIGAVGIFLLLRKLAVRKEIALIFGICFALLPKIFAHYGAGHITYIYAVCLTPILMWFETKRKPARLFLNLPTIILSALIILADIRWYPFAMVAWMCTVILKWDETSKEDEANARHEFSHFLKTGKQLLVVFAESVLGSFIAAPFILPFIEFLQRSTRISMVGGENLIYSLPPSRILGLFLPPEGGFPEWIIYAGLGMIFLIFIPFLSMKWKLIFPTGVFIFSLIWSLGRNVPLIGLFESLPVVNLIRVPPRMIFLGEMMAIIACGMTLEWMCSQAEENVKKRIRLSLTGTGIFILLLGAGIWIMQHQVTNSILRLVILSPGYFMSLILLIRYRKKIIPLVIFGMVALLDLYFTDITLFTSRPLNGLDDAKAVEIIKNDEGKFRVFSPSYSISQEIAGKVSIQLVEGVNPMQLNDYVQFLEKATGIPYDAYSVVIPPLLEKSIDNDIHNYEVGEPESKSLGLLNVRYIIQNKQIKDSDGWQLLTSSDGSWIYRNLAELPRAYLLGIDGTAFMSDVLEERYTPNEISISTSNGAGNLVLSEIFYPGWQAWVDGVKRPIIEYKGIFRSIELNQGAHLIIFKYQPKSVFFGLLISGITLLALLGIAIKRYVYR